MQYLADTDRLVADGVLSAEQARIIRLRSRDAMVALVVNSVLCAGIVAAASGFIFWLADPMTVAVTGLLFLAAGIAILARAGRLYAMLGHAAALIGAGMLMGGATIEIIDKLGEDAAGGVLLTMGGVIAVAAALLRRRLPATLGFLLGSVLVMGAAMHLAGLYLSLEASGTRGLPVALVHLYAAVVVGVIGVLVDVRLLTALAVLPFAQMLDTATAYFGAIYAFISPEPTLSILQMAVLALACLWVRSSSADRMGRHAGILGIMAVVVGNLCFLVGSLWGDVVGSHIWFSAADTGDWEAWDKAQKEFAETTLVISAGVYSIIWAVALAGLAFWAAAWNRRGIFNAALTFAAIHGYTQAFESFGDQPLAYVVGGLAAIPLAWGAWRINQRFPAAPA